MIRLAVVSLYLVLATASTGLAQTTSGSVTTIPASDPSVNAAPASGSSPPPASNTTPAPAPDSAPAAAGAAPTPASAVAASDSTAAVLPDSAEIISPASKDTPITVVLKDGTERHYVRVERSGSFLIGWRPDGGTDNIRVSKVARVTGDVTSVVMEGEEVGKKKENKKAPGKPFLRGSPLPEQKTFLVVQAGALARADSHSDEEDSHAWFDVGGMKNVSPKIALGGTIGVADDGKSYTRIVVKPRLRRWLGRGYAFDVAPGVFFPTGDAHTDPYGLDKLGSVGVTGELALTVQDWVQVSYVVEAIDREKSTYFPGLGTPASTSSGTEVFHYIGLKAGGAVGLVLTVLTFAGVVSNAD